MKSICTSDEFSKKRLLNIFDLKNRLNSLDIFMKEGSFNKVKMVINRFCKLSSNGNLKTDVLFIEDHVNPDLFEKECESKVHKFIRELESLSLSRNCYYLKLLKLFITHAEDLEEFFDNENGVLVMSDNKEIKNNRLNLISIVRNYSLMIADFTLL